MGEGLVEPGDNVDLNNPMGMVKSGLSPDFNDLSLVRSESSNRDTQTLRQTDLALSYSLYGAKPI